MGAGCEDIAIRNPRAVAGDGIDLIDSVNGEVGFIPVALRRDLCLEGEGGIVGHRHFEDHVGSGGVVAAVATLGAVGTALGVLHDNEGIGGGGGESSLAEVAGFEVGFGS